MVQIGDVIEMRASSRDFMDLLTELEEERVENVEKNIEGRECICVRVGGFRGWENNGPTNYTVKFQVIEVK